MKWTYTHVRTCKRIAHVKGFSVMNYWYIKDVSVDALIRNGLDCW